LRIFLTCRNGAYDWNLYNFSHYSIRPFSWSEQATWVSRRLGNTAFAVEFLSALRTNPDLLAVASNPLALSITAALYSRGWCFPTNISRVIASVVDAILGQWDGNRGVQRTSHALSDPDNKRALFSELASTSLHSVSPTIPEVMAFLLHKLIAVFRPQASTHPEFVLKLLREHTGFLQCNSIGVWGFSHPAISNYFAARAFVESVSTTAENLSTRLTERKWQQTWLVACGVTNDATDLISAMVRATGVPDPAKATLLVKALGEAKMVDPNLYEDCVTGIAKLLEAWMRDLRESETLESKLETSATHVRFFTVPKDADVHFSDGSSLRVAIFYRRKNESLKRLIEILRISRIGAVRTFVGLCDFEGEYSESQIESRLRCTVSNVISHRAGGDQTTPQ
jgi:hypothetical protein